MAGSSRVETDDLEGLTVGAIRRRYAGTFNIPAEARPNLNGRTASETDEVEDGDELVFAKPSGSKGR